MKIFTWSDEQNEIEELSAVLASYKGSGISVGSFDGFHLGHQALISKLVEKCRLQNLASIVITFTQPLPSVKNKKTYLGDISPLSIKLDILEKMNVDFVILAEFTSNFAAMSGEEFFQFLISRLNLKYIAEGVDFRCGYKGSFGIEEISTFCQANNIEKSFLEPVVFNDEENGEFRISSSIVRDAVSKGKIELANKLLNRNYELIIPENAVLSVSDIDKTLFSNDKININLRNKIYIDGEKINQVLPPAGCYEIILKDCKNQRIEQKKSSATIYELSDLNGESKKIIEIDDTDFKDRTILLIK